jgi:predicted regulator of Ras-like GTPase activity (Roadblock/LC7/MglB family)
MAEDALLAEMRVLQDHVTGVTGTAVASRDGLIVRADTSGVDPDNLAAISATWLALTQRLSREVGQGSLREAMARSAGGYVAIYAVGTSAVLVVIGDEGLDVPRLHREVTATREVIEALLSDPARASSGR